MNGKFKPEALYTETDMEKVKIVPFETAVVGKVESYDANKRKVFVDLGNSWVGIIPEDEITVYELSCAEGKCIPGEISGLIGRQIRAIVTSVDYSKNIVILSRRLSMKQAWEAMEEGTILTACITNNVGYGIFLDIGNGIVTYNSRVECAIIRISDTSMWFEIGDIVRVKLISKGSNENSRVKASYKLAYPDMTEADKIICVGDIIPVQIGKGRLTDGYFCQFGPQIKGIIDTYEFLYEGEVVMGIVKKITEKGLKLKHFY